ncbi:MAG: single-stranded-DNA-specific exonuclease RecJ [Streptococcaceae bacterium]|jgi:single-stranded-DNA-specific exonuclease|nr:single-stranded-DNA-specific exonuclease RecJ [Streptococcaceae bacterium]
MIQSKYDWKLLDVTPTEEFQKITKKLKLDQLAANTLWERGLHGQNEIEDFLNPSLDQLHDPYLLHDMEKAVTRIRQAIEAGEKILIYGDYDADGMTSASIMKSALDELGADEQSQVYLPNRFTDGYGPNLEVYKYWIEKEDITLIITVDNGIAGLEPIAWAQAKGVDVIVTDHHSLADELPNAFAIVHPRHPESQYPFDDLCGAGVAFKVATALLENVPVDMLDLAAIGTVADMVSLTDENRVIVALGLKQLQATDRIGLLELMRLAGCDLSNLNEDTIGFQIAPRLNALGRLDDPNPAVKLLIGWDEEECIEIAKTIDQWNSKRRTITDKIYQEAESMLDTDALVQVLYHSGWNKGVLGIVAGRLLEKIHRPVLILAEEDGILRGSGRSIEGFNIFEAMNKHRELFITFGGHAQACGLTIAQENVEKLKAVLAQELIDQKIDLDKKPEISLIGSLVFDDISIDTVKSLSKLAPFGMNNPLPRFLAKNYQVVQSRTMGADNQHLKLQLAQGKTQIDAVYFGHGDEQFEFEQVESELVVGLSANSWNGQTTLQMMIEDAKVVGIELLDIRSRKISLPENAVIFEKNYSKSDIMEKVLVVLDAPEDSVDFANLSQLIKENDFQVIYFKNQLKKSYYLSGAGTHEQFAMLYRALSQYPEFDVRYKLGSLSNYLKIPEGLLQKMIQVFEELGFVKIDEGLMTKIKDAPHKEISSSRIYQELLKTIQLQEFFSLAPVKEIYQKLMLE